MVLSRERASNRTAAWGGERPKCSDQSLESLVGMFARSQTKMQEYGVVTKVSANKKGLELLLDAKVFYGNHFLSICQGTYHM